MLSWLGLSKFPAPANRSLARDSFITRQVRIRQCAVFFHVAQCFSCMCTFSPGRAQCVPSRHYGAELFFSRASEDSSQVESGCFTASRTARSAVD